MSELIQKHDNRTTIRWKLLTGASALALIASSPSMASDSTDHPLLWIEIGGDANMLSGFGDRFTAPFLEQTPTPTPYLNGSPVDLQKPPRFTFGGEGKLTFQPENSDWVISAGIKYGRSSNKRDVHHQTVKTEKFKDPEYVIQKLFYPSTPTRFTRYPAYIYPSGKKFSDTVVGQSERHMVLDFQAGKDVGLGLFGRDSTSVLSAGVRVARFTSHSDVKIRAKPDLQFYTATFFYGLLNIPATRWSTYYLHGQADRSFSGIGPSLSWSASIPVAGNTNDGELSVDGGINGALLFGRQKARVSHQTTKRELQPKYYHTITSAGGFHHQTRYTTMYRNNPPAQNRSRNVTVPNLGANIGLSYRIEDAKLSIGYRTDNFFGAMDGGIDKAKKTTLGFNGLYASISIGLGD